MIRWVWVVHKAQSKADDAVMFPKLTWTFRFAPFFARSDIIWCCLFSAARWRQARPASTHRWGQSEVRRDYNDEVFPTKESNRDHDYPHYTGWLFLLGNNHRNEAWNAEVLRHLVCLPFQFWVSRIGSNLLGETCLVISLAISVWPCWQATWSAVFPSRSCSSRLAPFPISSLTTCVRFR